MLGGSATTLIVIVVDVLPAAFAALIVYRVEGLSARGTPTIAPDVVEKNKPTGNDGEIANVIGCVPEICAVLG